MTADNGNAPTQTWALSDSLNSTTQPASFIGSSVTDEDLPAEPAVTHDDAFALADAALDDGASFSVLVVEFLLEFGVLPTEIGAWARRRGVSWDVFRRVTEQVFGDDISKNIEALEGWTSEPSPTDGLEVVAVSGDSEVCERTLDGWTPPIPLGYHQDLPAFPLQALPPWLRSYVEAVARFTQTPTDLASMVSLAVTSTVVAKRFQVRVRGHWIEPLNIYIIVALRSGERKSAVMRLLVAPVERLEVELRAAVAPRIREAEARKKAAEAVAKAAQKDAEKEAPLQYGDEALQPDEYREEALRLAIEAKRQADEIVVPPWPRFIADDITQEALASMLAEQAGRVAILSEEGGFIEILAGRYAEGRPNIDTFLKGHSGDPIRVDRKGRPSERVENPAITVGVTVQPDVVQGLARVKGFRGRGLIARILFSLPASRVGRRVIEPDLIPEDVKQTYDAKVLAMGTGSSPLEEGTVTLFLDELAYRRLVEFQEELEPQLEAGARLGHIADWAGKLVGAAVRIAGLLHVAEHAGKDVPSRIRLETIEASITIAEYLVPHALSASDLMGTDQIIEDARRVLSWIGDRRLETFTGRDAFQALKGTFKKMTRLREALKLLVEHHYLHEPTRSKKSGPGRPSSPTFWVNPWIHT